MRLLNSRRTMIALAAIASLLVLGLVQAMDVASAIASVAIAVAGSNAVQSAVSRRRGDADAE